MSKSKAFRIDAEDLRRLRDQLDGNDSEERKAAAKRVVALMRAGENVGNFFSSMLRSVNTQDLELKRLVYLYLVTYSEQESEEAIMAVNIFVKDSEDYNPLIRALAVRTMSRIKIDTIAENMILPIKKRLTDKDPYVRKTASLAVCKLYSTIPDAVESAGIFEELIKLLQDDNPMVVSNTAASICEINSIRKDPIFSFSENVDFALNALPSCSEWCQCTLLDAVASFEPRNASDAANVIDRLYEFVKNANPSVSIGALRAVLSLLEYDNRPHKKILAKVVPPLVSLVSVSDPEIQFVVLKTLTAFVEKYPKSLSKELRSFYCKYNDPPYVKTAKLGVLMKLVTEKTAKSVVDELTEYCNAVDIGFVKRSVRCLGTLALKIPRAAPACVDSLVGLVRAKATYAVEESVIALTDILRAFPGQFESAIEAVCANTDAIQEPSARAALIWILGEYCGLIESVDVVIDPFLDTFKDDPPEVQIQTLTAVVKLYLSKPQDTKDQLQFVLSEATSESLSPDVRNRALTYWRLLSGDESLEFSRKMVTFTKKPITASSLSRPPAVVDDILRNVGRVSGVLHTASADFAKRAAVNVERDYDTVLENDNISVGLDFEPGFMHMRIENTGATVLSQLALAINQNAFGFSAVCQNFPTEINPGCILELDFDVAFDGNDPNKCAPANPSDELQFALRTSIGIQYFSSTFDIHKFTSQQNRVSRREFLALFDTDGGDVIRLDSSPADRSKLRQRRVQVVAERDAEMCVAFSIGDSHFIADICHSETGEDIATVKGNPAYYRLLEKCLSTIICD